MSVGNIRVHAAAILAWCVLNASPAAQNHLSTGARPAPPVTVDAKYPGGNIVLERTEGDSVFLHQELRDTKGWWFYWGFRIRGAAARTLTFHFTNKNVIGVRGPAVSRDKGRTWQWMGTDTVRATPKGVRFSYSFETGEDDVRFCYTMPYQRSDLDEFLKQHGDRGHVRVEELCTTRDGRSNPRLHAGCIATAPRHRVLVTCRHHACETMASYALEGLLAKTLENGTTGEWFRKHVEILAVPFMDLDGVERGDQGKNRKPRDHNRDYGGETLYPSVRALRKLVPEWSRGRLAVALDLHCPYIRGKHNEVIYLVGSESTAVWGEQCAFAAILETWASDNLPFGRAWNTKANYRQGTSFGRWAQDLPGIRLATTLELPYANAAGKAVTTESARAFGADLAEALRRYLSTRDEVRSGRP